MNLHALRIYCSVASKKSVTEAAKALLISQPAVTMQIRNLEKETGLTLMVPKGRGIELTEAGEFLFKQAERLFDMEADIEKKLEQYKKGEQEELRLSSTYLPANFLLPAWLAKFKNQFPLVHVNVYSGNSEQAIDKLLHYQTDVAFVVKEKWTEPDIALSHIMDIHYWFIVPKGHKYDGKEVMLSDLVQEPFIMRETGSSTREILFSLFKIHGVEPPYIGLQLHGFNESIRAVIAGYGVMLAPSLAVQDHLDRKEIGRTKVQGIEVKRPVYLCRRKADKHMPLTLKHFLELVKDETM
ncbi:MULTISPECIES: LysR family transcriptional regulator [Paenibacillus]|nr:MULTISPECIES: LysR family transcriptional regulator [Paenibacillus]GCL74116.1 LysR family transcriptional regulator [Paenibacillus naphthalenovorans]SDJ35067.1 DNA-binding transcriptional regulator, LysR family [Paenibacillus naphthalenovorans]